MEVINYIILFQPLSFDGQSPRAKSESLSGGDKARFAISRSKSLCKLYTTVILLDVVADSTKVFLTGFSL